MSEVDGNTGRGAGSRAGDGHGGGPGEPGGAQGEDRHDEHRGGHGGTRGGPGRQAPESDHRMAAGDSHGSGRGDTRDRQAHDPERRNPVTEPELRDLLRGDTTAAARALVGHTLVRTGPDGLRREGRIIETEAYTEDDPSSHSYRGVSTRNASMFEDAGTAYVYLIYGIHCCLNVVTGPAGRGEAVLIRAVEPTEGLAAMAAARGVGAREVATRGAAPRQAGAREITGTGEALSGKTLQKLCSGPGKLCEALGVDRSFDGVDLLSANSTLYIDGSVGRSTGRIVATTRIGISRAKDMPRRFLEAGNRFVSRPEAT